MTWWVNNGCSVRSTNCHYRKVTTTFWSVFLQVIIELTLQLFLLMISAGRKVESRIYSTIVCYDQLLCVSAGVWTHTLVWSLMNVQKPSGETEINKHVETVASSLSIHFFTPPNKLNKYAITSALIICGAAKCEKLMSQNIRRIQLMHVERSLELMSMKVSSLFPFDTPGLCLSINFHDYFLVCYSKVCAFEFASLLIASKPHVFNFCLLKLEGVLTRWQCYANTLQTLQKYILKRINTKI